MFPLIYFAQKLPVPHPICNILVLPLGDQYILSLLLLLARADQDRETDLAPGVQQQLLQLGHVCHDRVQVRDRGASLLLLQLGPAGHNRVQGIVTLSGMIQPLP